MVTSTQRWQMLIVIGFLLCYGALINSRAFSANDWSRLGALESLVERGTWRLDDSPFLKTIDKIQVDGHFYSDKPPTFAFLGAGVYAVLHHGLGLELQAQGCDPGPSRTGCLAWGEPATADWAYVLLVLLLVSLPAALMLALLFGVTQRQGWSPGRGLLLTVSVGVGTAVWPYSTIFVNHVPAAAALLAALYSLWRSPGPRSSFSAGFLATLAATLDLSTAVYLAAIGGYMLLYRRAQLRHFVLGGLPPGLLAVALNLSIIGNPLPPQLYTAGYEFAGSRFEAVVAGNQTADSPLRYAWRLLFGDWGVLAFYPVVAVYLAGLWRTLRLADPHTRRFGWLVALGTLGYLSYFILFTNNFGGTAFGVRWLLVPLPLLALFPVLAPGWQQASRWLPIVLLLLLLPSAWMGYRGALAPWVRDLPPTYLAFTTPEARQPLAISLSGLEGIEAIDPALRASLGDRPQQRRRFDARHAFVVPAASAWWFIGAQTPPAALFQEGFELQLPPGGGLQADLTPAAEAWISRMQPLVFQDPQLVPAEAPAQRLALPQRFVHPQGELALRGFEGELDAGQFRLVTAWEVLPQAYSPGERRIFLHLLNAQGELVAQSDRLDVAYASLEAGDIIFQQQFLAVNELPAGDYWLQMGVYEPASGLRLTVGEGDRLLLLPLSLPER